MFDELQKLFQIDWRIFMAGAEAWLNGRNPYAALSSEFSAGAFAYPPTALTWLALFVPLGPLGYYVWTGLELLLWWLLIRKDRRSQLLLLCWSPMILHLVEGQSSLAVVLVMWAATRAERRSWLWGLAIAWALTKPQVAIVPLLWLLWQDRMSPTRWRLCGGIALSTLLLALPPTLLSASATRIMRAPDQALALGMTTLVLAPPVVWEHYFVLLYLPWLELLARVPSRRLPLMALAFFLIATASLAYHMPPSVGFYAHLPPICGALLLLGLQLESAFGRFAPLAAVGADELPNTQKVTG